MNPWMNNDEVVAHRARFLHRHHVARGVGVAGPGLGVDRPAARHRAAVLHQRGGAASHVGGDEVERAQLVIVAPTPPVGVLACANGRTPRRWVGCAPGCPCADGNPAATVAARGGRRVRPVLRRGDDRPVPGVSRLRAGGPVVALPEYDAFALHAIRRRVAACSPTATASRSSRVRCSTATRCCGITTVRPTPTVAKPVPTFSMLDPPVHTQLRQAMLGPFRPRGHADGGHGAHGSRASGSTRWPRATSSTCATTTRRRWPRRSRRCSSASRWRTPSCSCRG